MAPFTGDARLGNLTVRLFDLKLPDLLLFCLAFLPRLLSDARLFRFIFPVFRLFWWLFAFSRGRLRELDLNFSCRVLFPLLAAQRTFCFIPETGTSGALLLCLVFTRVARSGAFAQGVVVGVDWKPTPPLAPTVAVDWFARSAAANLEMGAAGGRTVLATCISESSLSLYMTTKVITTTTEAKMMMKMVKTMVEAEEEEEE